MEGLNHKSGTWFVRLVRQSYGEFGFSNEKQTLSWKSDFGETKKKIVYSIIIIIIFVNRTHLEIFHKIKIILFKLLNTRIIRGTNVI